MTSPDKLDPAPLWRRQRIETVLGAVLQLCFLLYLAFALREAFSSQPLLEFANSPDLALRGLVERLADAEFTPHPEAGEREKAAVELARKLHRNFVVLFGTFVRFVLAVLFFVLPGTYLSAAGAVRKSMLKRYGNGSEDPTSEEAKSTLAPVKTPPR